MASINPEKIKAAERLLKERAAQKAAALKQADADALRFPEEPVVRLKKGETPTLHELNANAKRYSRQVKDMARQAGAAAGRAVMDTLTPGHDEAKKKAAKKVSQTKAAQSHADKMAAPAQTPSGRKLPN